MNILVTGANGQLGNEIQKVSKHSQDHYIFTDVCDGYEKLDITNLDAMFSGAILIILHAEKTKRVVRLGCMD